MMPFSTPHATYGTYHASDASIALQSGRRLTGDIGSRYSCDDLDEFRSRDLCVRSESIRCLSVYDAFACKVRTHIPHHTVRQAATSLKEVDGSGSAPFSVHFAYSVMRFRHFGTEIICCRQFAVGIPTCEFITFSGRILPAYSPSHPGSDRLLRNVRTAVGIKSYRIILCHGRTTATAAGTFTGERNTSTV